MYHPLILISISKREIMDHIIFPKTPKLHLVVNAKHNVILSNRHALKQKIEFNSDLRLQHVKHQMHTTEAEWFEALFSRRPGSQGLWFNPHPRIRRLTMLISAWWNSNKQ